MSGYSMAAESKIGEVRPRDVWALLEIVGAASLRDLPLIEARYVERASNFGPALELAEAMGWIHRLDGKCLPARIIAERASAAQGDERAEVFADGLFAASKPYQVAFARFLQQFEFHDAECVCKPGLAERVRDAGVRNFLMELGVVTYRAVSAEYVLEPKYYGWLPWARGVVGPSAEELAERVEARVKIGFAAELEALQWERARLGAEYHDRIRHVARDFPTAGFDIQSVTLTEGRTEPRFIEVKAIRSDDEQFHWSRSEVELAAALGKSYFLYLVSQDEDARSKGAHVEVIEDAYRTIFDCPSPWQTKVADTVCRRVRGSR